MNWNYRIIKRESSNKWLGTFYEIIEAYYGEDSGEIMLYSDTVHPSGDTPDELKADLELMLGAFSRPVLTEADLPKEEDV